MKQKDWIRTLLVLAVVNFVFALFMFAIAQDLENSNIEEKTVNCYDKYGNEIKDQTCIEEPTYDSQKEKETNLVFFFICWILGHIVLTVLFYNFEKEFNENREVMM